MNNLPDMIWVESRKAIRSRMPLWTALASLFMPLGIAFLLFVAKNPEISQKLGLISAKANLMAYAATDWPTYLGLYGQLIAAGGYFLFIMAISWTFGREFVDGTLKDLLAVPVSRFSILLAKFIVAGTWSVMLSLVILVAGLAIGALIRLPGFSTGVILRGSGTLAIIALMVILDVTPFAFFASAGRGYLLPIGMAILALMMANLVGLIGWGAYYPWAIPVIYGMGKESLAPISYWIVLLTSLAGIAGTYLWWKHADHNR